MKWHFIIPFLSIWLTSCSTLNESLQFGAGIGGISGAVATYAAYATSEHSPSLQTVGIGAGLGLGIGVITSYFIHQKLDEQRKAEHTDQFEMNFGDLPPSPFTYPKPAQKKGVR